MDDAHAQHATTPTAIRLDLEANRLRMSWRDGHESEYDGAYLRWTCPCAGCRGHYAGQVPEPQWQGLEHVRITSAEQVGTYALRFDFSDGHATGIYSFDHLRRVCPTTRDDLDAEGRPLA